jgi:hypothetical protein
MDPNCIHYWPQIRNTPHAKQKLWPVMYTYTRIPQQDRQVAAIARSLWCLSGRCRRGRTPLSGMPDCRRECGCGADSQVRRTRLRAFNLSSSAKPSLWRAMTISVEEPDSIPQCRKCLTPVKTMAIPASSAALITSSSRIDPPGWITAVAPASIATRSPSANGKKASDATTEPLVMG